MKAVIANLGFILQTTGIVTLFAVIPAFAYNEQKPLISFFITSVVFLVAGFLMNALCQRKELDFKSSCILISIAFFALGIIGAIPFLYSNVFTGADVTSKIINSFFESVSGYTSTGMSMITNLDTMPRSIIFYRGLTQWIGGIGIVFIVLVFFDSSDSLEKLGKAIGFKKLTSTMTNTYIRIFGIYSAYTIIFFGILYATGIRDWVTNISLVLSGISTGGFSPANDLSALMKFPSNIVMIFLMIAGATSFVVHFRIFLGKFKKAANLEFVVFVSLIFVFSIIFWLTSKADIAASFFHVTSAATTTGYSYINPGSMAPSAIILLLILMFIGGSTYSTAGGVKVMSIIIFFKSIYWIMKGIFNGNLEPFVLRRKELSYLDVSSSLVLIIVAMSIIILLAFVFTCFGYSMQDSIFEITAAISNGGLSVGIATPSLEAGLKLVLAFVMIIGRIGIIAFFIAILPKLMQKTAPPIKTIESKP
jgi:trk system potassium uptake protein TrkH